MKKPLTMVTLGQNRKGIKCSLQRGD